MKTFKYLLSPFIALSLCSCTTYSSKYSAFILITHQSNTESSIRFEEFTGRYVFKMKKTSDGEGAIAYHASLEKGSVNVSYVVNNKEVALFTIKDGESFDSFGGYVEHNQKVLIIVDSNNEKVSKGDFTFTFTN